jgi:2-keto-4-pentenoate hydratase/2-oxohepta-3-ene-1,7-dioic acid hydratase in catechol pathway
MSKTLKFTDGTTLQPGTMYCIGRNYAAHAREMGATTAGDPVIFLKPPAAYIENGEEIIIPDFSNDVHHEVELVAVIGKDCANINNNDAHEYIAGYAVGVDVTLRDVQSRAKESGKPWATAKGFYTSAPMSQIIPAAEIADPAELEIELEINGELRQKASTSLMVRTVGEIVSYLSKVFTLRRGDIIFTGTPSGVGPIGRDDSVTARLIGYAELNITAK